MLAALQAQLVRFSKQQYVFFFLSAYTDRIYLKIHFWGLQLILIPSEIVLSKSPKSYFRTFGQETARAGPLCNVMIHESI